MPCSKEFRIEEAMQILAATPQVLSSQLRGLGRSWIVNNYGTETFSPYDVIRHLIHGERVDWVPRLRIILEWGERRTFEPFDIRGLHDEGDDKSIGQLLDLFADLRTDNLQTIADMQLEDDRLALRGMHPELGVVTVSQLIATWAAHDLNHIHQICKCLAYQYRNEMGPWKALVTFIHR